MTDCINKIININSSSSPVRTLVIPCLVALLPRLHSSNSRMSESVTVEVVLKNINTGTGEGPHWDAETQTLYFVDITEHNIKKWNYNTGEVSQIHLGKTLPPKGTTI